MHNATTLISTVDGQNPAPLKPILPKASFSFPPLPPGLILGIMVGRKSGGAGFWTSDPLPPGSELFNIKSGV